MAKGLVCILLLALFMGCWGTEPYMHSCTGQNVLILSDGTGNNLSMRSQEPFQWQQLAA